MPVLVVAGCVLAGLALAGGLLWRAWGAHAAATRRQGERVERKIDILLEYLALERERRDIDAEGGRDR